MKRATEIPIQIAKDSIKVAKHGLVIFNLGFQSARGDSAVAISAALAGAAGALSVVYLNLTYFRGKKWAMEIREQANDLNEQVQELQQESVSRLLIFRTEAVSRKP